jgi:protein-tyrosine kinase
MSKFFNQTLRARDSQPPIEETNLADVRESQIAATAVEAPAPVSDVGGSRLEQCEKISIPVKNLLHAQFKGSDSLAPAEESYRALRTRLLRLRSAQGLRSVVVTSASQGEGKTLTSLNLALCCAQLQGMRVLLIDGDVRSRGLSHALGLPEGPGLCQVLAGECEPLKAVTSTDVPNLYVLGAGSSSTPPAELFASHRWQELISSCSESFRLILIDSPPVMDLADVELISAACDGVLMVVRAQRTRRDVLQKSASLIDPKKLLGVVYNGTEGAHHRYHYGLKER